MLHQSRSKAIKKFKYLLMLPLVLGMLVYTSCENEQAVEVGTEDLIENPKLKGYYLKLKKTDISDEGLLEGPMFRRAKVLMHKEILQEEEFYEIIAIRIVDAERAAEKNGFSIPEKEAFRKWVKADYDDYDGDIFKFLNPGSKESFLNKDQQDQSFSTVAIKPAFATPCEEGQDAFQCFKESLDAHVRNTFRYPAEAQEKGIQGRVFLNFKIDTDGSVSVLQSRAPHELLDAEARRIIGALPKLTPGKKADGTPVAITFAYPIIFKLGTSPINENATSATNEDLNQKYGFPYTKIPVKPSFKTLCEDGQEALDCFRQKLDAHVIDNFRYPEEAKTAGLEGRVYLYFRIEASGNVKVLSANGPDKSLEQEATRIIESLPQLNPGGDEDGNPVPVLFAYPIVFKLGGAEGGETGADLKSKDSQVNLSFRNSFEKGKVSGTLTYGGEGVAGANVYLKEKDISSVSDFDGNFKIAASANDVIIVQHIDFGEREFKVLQ